MKLLFDQNISYRVVKPLHGIIDHSAHVRELGLENASDRDIWNYARMHGFTIVTFDADFYELATLFGHPPKIIWLRMGNVTTDDIILVLQSNHALIEAFCKDEEYSGVACLELAS